MCTGAESKESKGKVSNLNEHNLWELFPAAGGGFSRAEHGSQQHLPFPHTIFASEGAPQAEMYQLWMSYMIQAPAKCLEAHSIFSLLPISSQKTAAYSSKHPFVETSFVISLVSTILPTKIKKPLMIKDLQWLCSRILPSKSTSAAQNILFQRKTKQNPLPLNQLNPSQAT